MNELTVNNNNSIYNQTTPSPSTWTQQLHTTFTVISPDKNTRVTSSAFQQIPRHLNNAAQVESSSHQITFNHTKPLPPINCIQGQQLADHSRGFLQYYTTTYSLANLAENTPSFNNGRQLPNAEENHASPSQQSPKELISKRYAKSPANINYISEQNLAKHSDHFLKYYTGTDSESNNFKIDSTEREKSPDISQTNCKSNLPLVALNENIDDHLDCNEEFDSFNPYDINKLDLFHIEKPDAQERIDKDETIEEIIDYFPQNLPLPVARPLPLTIEKLTSCNPRIRQYDINKVPLYILLRKFILEHGSLKKAPEEIITMLQKTLKISCDKWCISQLKQEINRAKQLTRGTSFTLEEFDAEELDTILANRITFLGPKEAKGEVNKVLLHGFGSEFSKESLDALRSLLNPSVPLTEVSEKVRYQAKKRNLKPTGRASVYHALRIMSANLKENDKEESCFDQNQNIDAIILELCKFHCLTSVDT